MNEITPGLQVLNATALQKKAFEKQPGTVNECSLSLQRVGFLRGYSVRDGEQSAQGVVRQDAEKVGENGNIYVGGRKILEISAWENP